MPRPTKSSWDFGELFPPESTRRMWSVSELTSRVRRLLEQEVGRVWVTGEITNLRAQSSGHLYFTLKDAGAQLQCVLFRSEPAGDRSMLADGRCVNLEGELTVYEVRGQYQLRVVAMEIAGLGALQAAFERLKQKLQGEGLFDSARKRKLPRYPERLGLVTSPTGAAIRDVLHVVRRRQPWLDLVLAPCRVQGEGAAEEIAAALDLLNRWHQADPSHALDVILVTRGGGSLEDLWAFNEEAVARAIARSEVPVVSAVGHEIDVTIADFVADLRAATPSAAAELITEGPYVGGQFVVEAGARLTGLARRRLEAEARQWRQWAQRLALLHPRRWLRDRAQLLDDYDQVLSRCARRFWSQLWDRVSRAQERLGRLHPAMVLTERRRRLGELGARLDAAWCRQEMGYRHRWSTASARLRLLSPQNTVDRGYSITRREHDGRIVRSPADVKSGEVLMTRVRSGEIKSRVEP